MVKGKKGLAVEIIYLVIILFFLAVSLISVVFVNDQIAEVIKSNEKLNSTDPADDIISALDTINSSTVDNSFAFIAGALILGVLISAFLSRIHPAWFFVFVLISAITIIIAAPISNIYEEILANETFAASVASEQTSINFFMENLVIVSIVTAVLGTIIALSKQDSVQSFGSADI